MELKAGEMGEKIGEKEKFSFWHFCGEKSEKVTKLRSGYAAGLPVCGTAKTQRKRGLLRPRQINRASAKHVRCQCGYRELREAHDRTTRCCAPVESALAGLTFSGSWRVGGYAANSSFIIHHWPAGPVDACSCFCEADVNR